MADIEQPIMDFVAALDDTRTVPIAADTPLLEDGLLDSINLVQLIQFIEERFAISIPDSDLGAETFASVATISAYVASRVG